MRAVTRGHSLSVFIRHSDCCMGLWKCACIALLSLLIFLTSGCDRSSSIAKTTTLPEDEDFFLLEHASGGCSVVLRSAPWKGDAEESHLFWGSFGGESPVVVSMSLTKDSTRMWLRRSAYSDLAEVNQISVDGTENGCHILITGGDASTGYKAEIIVEGEYIVRRTVRSGSFPDHHYEETIYVNLPVEE
jgi:hypothetical protein